MTEEALMERVRIGQPMLVLVRRLWHHMGLRRQRQFALLLGLMVLASFAELLSIGAVLPFLTALTQPHLVFNNASARPLLAALGIVAAAQLTVALTGLFIVATIFACVIRSSLLWCSTRLSFALGSDITNRLYESTLHQPYAMHVSRNSSEVVNAIGGKVSEVIFYILLPSMNFVTSAIVTLAICAALAWAIPATALAALGILVVVYALIIKLSRRRLKVNSVRIAQGTTDVIKTLQEGLGGIRDILIDGSQANFAASYRDVDQRLRKAQGDNQIISQGPRYLLEAMGMLLIAALAYMLTTRAGGAMAAIPMLAAIALGMQRLMPAAQLMFSAWSTVHGGQASLQDVLDMLDLPLPEGVVGKMATPPIAFQRDIRLRDISFRHKVDGPWLFDGIDLTISKGARVGFMGVTGSGKSTLLDIAMGLLEPSTGRVEIDGIAISSQNRNAWQRHIAHVPQSVFLADCSLEENIAFGVPKAQIDLERVRQAARQAQLADLVDSWPQGYRTPVGERGVQLSGGQRQRIGIARALYKDADVIVFDEATSALDNETEHSVMQAIESLSGSITVLIIAHRLNTLKDCTDIIEVGNGSVTRRTALSNLSAIEAQ